MRHTQCHLLRLASALILAALPIAWLTGCASLHSRSMVIYEDADGVIYLEEIPNPKFRASHPTTIEQAMMGRVLRGIRVEQNIGPSGGSDQDGKHSLHVFSKEQIEFLSPLLTAALGQAQPEHWVVFRSIDSGATTPKVTAGTLYAHESLLYVTLTHFRDGVKEGDASQASFRLGLSATTGRRAFYFVPEVRGRLANRLPPGTPDMSPLPTLAVDVERLTPRSAPPVQQVGPVESDAQSTQAAVGPTEHPQPAEITTIAEIEAAVKVNRVKLEELQNANRLLGQKMAENAALQEDLRILKEKLAEHRALVDQLKRKEQKVR